MEILRAGEIEWVMEINSLTGYTDEVISLRGKYVPVIDLRQVDESDYESLRPETLISVLKKEGKIMALLISAIPEANC